MCFVRPAHENGEFGGRCQFEPKILSNNLRSGVNIVITTIDCIYKRIDCKLPLWHAPAVEGKMAVPKKKSLSRYKALKHEYYDEEHDDGRNNFDRLESPAASVYHPSGELELPFVSALDTARYIEEMASELRDIADRCGVPFLAYLLDLAVEEAKSQRQIAHDLNLSGRSQRHD